ncbi:TPA: CHAP domain-containing protein [Enterococcus faecium]|nr:CHAP domain-containing protein [Enterococcus faecium]
MKITQDNNQKEQQKALRKTLQKKTWKEQQKVTPRVKEGISKNAFLKPREATKTTKKSYKIAKKRYKLAKRKYKVEQQKYKRNLVSNEKKATVNHIIAKKNYLEAKTEKKVTKKVHRKTKAADTSRVSYQLKREAKQSVKNKVVGKVNEALREDDTLKEGVNLYSKAQRYKQNMRRGYKVSKNVGKVSLKAGKGTYGLGNRSYNYIRGRGFQRTPEDQTIRKTLMKKLRNSRQRFKMAREAKKAEQGLGLIRSIMNGQKTMSQAATLIIKSPITWIVLGLFLIVVIIAGAVGSSQRPAIVQDDFELTDSWTYFTKLDAEKTDTSNVFYTQIDDVMFYMNGVFDDYKLGDIMPVGSLTYKMYLSDLWEALNGKAPDYSITDMDKLMKDKKSAYYVAPDIYENLKEARDTFGYTTLENQLGNPFNTDSLVVTRRYGYERNGDNITLNPSIDISVTSNQELKAPMGGIVSLKKGSNSLTIEKDKSSRITLNGINPSRFNGGETISEGDYIGNATKESLQVKYEKFDKKTDKWKTVNPGFYFKKVTYTQFTSVGSSDFDPDGDVTKRAKTIYDELTKIGATREGISAVLGCFDVESSINPKRAEGDYLSPPVGATASSWDDPVWLAMGGMEIYGKYPNIIHRGLGLGQWTDTSDGGRRHTLLLDYAKSKNKKWYDLKLQIDFMLHGDTPGNRTAFMNTIMSKTAATIPELTSYFLTYWEGNPGDKLSQRIQSAQNWYNYFSSNSDDTNISGNEVFEKYKDKMKPLPTNKEMKDGWSGNSYALGNCTWYVYNRMKQFGKNLYPLMGNAKQWVYNYVQTPGASLVSSPKRGDVAIFTNGTAGSSVLYGHVAVVEYVNSDGSFVISEMNVRGPYTMGWRVRKKEPGVYFMRVQQ